MTMKIAELLASYLWAHPHQVLAWDRPVVDHLADDQRILTAFKQGCSQTRWRIYHALKYPGSVWATRN